jgi:hypothetical protein
MSTIECTRPPKLFRYSERRWLERSLTLGEFRLRPAADDIKPSHSSAAEQILPFGAAASRSAAPASYLTLSLTQVWDEKLFNEFPGTDSCLVIHNAEEFGERIHRAAQRILPNWAGIDAAISYGVPSPLGVAFSKAKQFASQKEWLFAWRPMQAIMSLNPVVIQIGNIEGIAELRERIA